jgi:DNA-directed RNA polymerase subunit RPC12/RpoP
VGELIPIENGRKEWAVDYVRCLTCGTQWVALYPASSDLSQLQCPTC